MYSTNSAARPLAARRRAAWLALLVVLAGATGPADAHAGPLLRWRSDVVTYRDTSSYPSAVRQAVRWINGLPARVRLVRARRDARAGIAVVSRYRPGTDWAGLASTRLLGRWFTRAVATLNTAYLDLDYVTDIDRAGIAAHELLHALGLPHLRGCALMHPHPVLGEDRCRGGLPDGIRRCGPQPSDVRALIGRYGVSLGGFAGYRCADPTVS